MPELYPPLRAVAPQAVPRRRGPGLAVVAVLLYGGLFGAGLLWFRSRSPLFQRSSQVSPSPRLPVSQSSPRREDGGTRARGDNRETLRIGEGLIGVAREEYLRRIATECCSCGCDLTLERCLATEKTCPESPERARMIREELR